MNEKRTNKAGVFFTADDLEFIIELLGHAPYGDAERIDRLRDEMHDAKMRAMGLDKMGGG